MDITEQLKNGQTFKNICMLPGFHADLSDSNGHLITIHDVKHSPNFAICKVSIDLQSIKHSWSLNTGWTEKFFNGVCCDKHF